MSPSVAIEGSGVAACCCAQLLQKGGSPTSVNPEMRSRGPVLMLSEQTQKLLADVFGTTSLFAHATPVRQRIVLWGKGSEVRVLPHAGIVLEETVLLEQLWNIVSQQPAAGSTNALGWRIISGQKLPAAVAYSFGTRVATASRIRFNSGAPKDACWMESLPQGWLFLLPSGSGTGSMLSVGGEPAALVQQSRLISQHVAAIEDVRGTFNAYPRINNPLCAPAWISCGTAALGFDPICGEGAGNAAREAILASAVILGAAKGLNLSELLSLYSSRLTNGFVRHLALCLEFYRSASQGDWWQSEISYLEEGIAWARQQISADQPPKYRLSGFELQPV
jgi:2-polyprenyl-6-methoxyphenol hydroxylase-like FAD-dependent oxidoreductase